MNGGLDQAKLNSFIMLLDTGVILSLVLFKWIENKDNFNKMTNPVCWCIPEGDLNIKYTTSVYILLNELDATKSVTRNFYTENVQRINEKNNIL